jgi:hypothetical protein
MYLDIVLCDKSMNIGLVVKIRHNVIPDDVVAICLPCHGSIQNIKVHFTIERKTFPHSNTSATIHKMCCSLYVIFLCRHTRMQPSIWWRSNLLSSDQSTLRHCLNVEFRCSHDHWCRTWRRLRFNNSLLIGLWVCKQPQLSLRSTVRTLTRPCSSQLSRKRRAAGNGRPTLTAAL